MSIAKTQAHPRAVKEPTRAARAALVTFENFDSLPDAAMVDARVVCLLLGKSMASTYRYLADGTIPSPVKIGKATLWRVRDLRTFFDGLPADREPGAQVTEHTGPDAGRKADRSEATTQATERIAERAGPDAGRKTDRSEVA